MAAAVAIALQASLDAGVLDQQQLEQLAAQAGLRVRRVASAPADLLVCRSGGTLPFLLWRGGGGGSTDGSGGSEDVNAARLAGLACFKQAYVLVPHTLMGDAAVLDAVCR